MEYRGSLKSKLPSTSTTIFAVMSQLAREHNAVNLSQGFPDFPVDKKLIALVNSKMKEGHNQYAPMQGIKPLRDLLAKKVRDLYSATPDPEEEITITAGGTQAIYTAITATVREGDEVIVFEPAYDCYVPAIKLQGGIPVQLQLKGKEFQIDWDEVKKMISQRTRMIIINTPHNPSGSVMSAKDMMTLEKITAGTDIIILSDEVYEHIIYDGLEHQSILRYPKLAERSFVVFSFGKTFHATGWKTGYVIAPSNLMKEFRKVHQYMVFSVHTPTQAALADYIEDPGNYKSLADFYQEKRDYFRQLLDKTKFRILECKGSYFQLLDYSQISDEKDTDFAVRVTREYGVAAIPVSVFYKNPVDNKIIRLCFAKEKSTLKEAAQRLKKVQ